jgi:hypothetical protein
MLAFDEPQDVLVPLGSYEGDAPVETSFMHLASISAEILLFGSKHPIEAYLSVTATVRVASFQRYRRYDVCSPRHPLHGSWSIA